MQWPWVSRAAFDRLLQAEQFTEARRADEYAERMKLLERHVALQDRYDALADKYVAHGTPVTLPTKQRDPVLDAISERAAGHPDLLRFLGVYARKARREHVPDEEIIATVSNWNRTERDLDNGEGLPD